MPLLTSLRPLHALAATGVLALAALLTPACSTPRSGVAADHLWTPSLELLNPQTIPDIGAGQGAALIDGRIYLYGDAETGVIREYTLHDPPDQPPTLRPTGRSIRLTRRGEDVAPHPTGLTHHPRYGTFLGDTVRQRGTIFHIDLERALSDGTLDNAILNQTNDDTAVNGTRPEFVRHAGRWLIATSDYGDAGNHVRLLDPGRLASASRTSSPDVLVGRFACGPFVQTLHWLDDRGILVLVQNQKPGLLYRLTFADLEASTEEALAATRLDLDHPRDELEGFVLLDDELCLMLSASRGTNLWFARLRDVPSPGE